MKTRKNRPQKLLIIHNQLFFSLPAWLPKRPILGINRNFIGSPCLLSTISLTSMEVLSADKLKILEILGMFQMNNVTNPFM